MDVKKSNFFYNKIEEVKEYVKGTFVKFKGKKEKLQIEYSNF